MKIYFQQQYIQKNKRRGLEIISLKIKVKLRLVQMQISVVWMMILT
jgi:hypothetical protein